MYCSTRCLGIDPLSSFTGALLVALDSSMIVEGKFILSDGLVHFWSAFHFYTLCLFLRRQSDRLALLCGLTLGIAGMCKFTALGLFAVDGVTQLVWILRVWPPFLDIVTRGIAFLVPAGLAIFLSWFWHFSANPYMGYHGFYIVREDAHTVLERAKINTSYWGNRILDSPLIKRIISWNVVMNRINMRSKIPHPWESRPQFWPFLLDKYVLFWANENRRITCMGLPTSYWSTTIALALTLPATILRRAGWQNALFLWGWAVSYLPFFRIPRTMFHYHYLVPLMFAGMNLAALLNKAVTDRKIRAVIAGGIIVLTVVCYQFFSPWIYGFNCPDCDKSRHWFRAWTHGPPKPLNLFGKELFNTTKKMMVTLPP
jgi:dolichyl-phosphate-mannose-protein mannosyltransferase